MTTGRCHGPWCTEGSLLSPVGQDSHTQRVSTNRQLRQFWGPAWLVGHTWPSCPLHTPARRRRGPQSRRPPFDRSHLHCTQDHTGVQPAGQSLGVCSTQGPAVVRCCRRLWTTHPGSSLSAGRGSRTAAGRPARSWPAGRCVHVSYATAAGLGWGHAHNTLDCTKVNCGCSPDTRCPLRPSIAAGQWFSSLQTLPHLHSV